jgi:hypothetical protein
MAIKLNLFYPKEEAEAKEACPYNVVLAKRGSNFYPIVYDHKARTYQLFAYDQTAKSLEGDITDFKAKTFELLQSNTSSKISQVKDFIKIHPKSMILIASMIMGIFSYCLTRHIVSNENYKGYLEFIKCYIPLKDYQLLPNLCQQYPEQSFCKCYNTTKNY